MTDIANMTADDLRALVAALTAENEELMVAKALPAPTGGSLSRRVEQLVMDGSLTYRTIVAMVKEEFPHANTSTKSVASVACVMRRKGHDVPKRVMY